MGRHLILVLEEDIGKSNRAGAASQTEREVQRYLHRWNPLAERRFY